MNWFAVQPGRANSERMALANLAETSEWLSNVSWRLGEGLHLEADFDINHLSRVIELRIVYPSFFPDVPPRIYPRNGQRISGHQYGLDGELCLELRPDNWHPDMTGVMMVESAHRLIVGEQPADNQTAQVANAHRLTQAQAIRSKNFRFMLSSEASDQLAACAFLSPIEVEIGENAYAEFWLGRLKQIGQGDNVHWKEPEVFQWTYTRWGYVVRLPDETTLPSAEPTYAYLAALSTVVGSEEIARKLESSKTEVPFLIVHQGSARLMSLCSGEGERTIFDYQTIILPPKKARLSQDYQALSEKKVAILGCGSVGSKLAVSLARTGVKKFVLVDGDMLYQDNLVRNELDIRSVGLNKPDGLAQRISEVNPGAEISKRPVLLGGQESSYSTEFVLQSVSECDLVIDATADAHIFNLCASVCRAGRKPLVWGEVFAGGVGGLIARSRPGLDPTPNAVRRQMAIWCADRGVPWDGGKPEGYDVTRDDAPPLIADDADVTVIASHLTRLAIDTLLREESCFPNSAYAIGLKKEWIFSAPFDTWPIELSPEGTWGVSVEENHQEELNELVAVLFPPETE